MNSNKIIINDDTSNDTSNDTSSDTSEPIKTLINTEQDFNDISIINLIEQFINKLNISKRLEGICILTIAQDKSSLCSCFVFNYNTKQILKHYPQRYDSNIPIYKTYNDLKFTINLSTSLPPYTENGKHSGKDEDINYYPFCCKNCKKSTNKLLSNEYEFDNFFNKKGSSSYIFNVTKKIQFGPLIFKKNFSIKNNKINEEKQIEDINKINSFKILTCSIHNTYYSINLNILDTTTNYHHAKGQNETFYGPIMLNIMMKIVI